MKKKSMICAKSSKFFKCYLLVSPIYLLNSTKIHTTDGILHAQQDFRKSISLSSAKLWIARMSSKEYPHRKHVITFVWPCLSLYAPARASSLQWSSPLKDAIRLFSFAYILSILEWVVSESAKNKWLFLVLS